MNYIRFGNFVLKAPLLFLDVHGFLLICWINESCCMPSRRISYDSAAHVWKMQLIVSCLDHPGWRSLFHVTYQFISLPIFSMRLWALLCTAICCRHHAYKRAKDDGPHFCIRQNGTARLWIIPSYCFLLFGKQGFVYCYVLPSCHGAAETWHLFFRCYSTNNVHTRFYTFRCAQVPRVSNSQNWLPERCELVCWFLEWLVVGAMNSTIVKVIFPGLSEHHTGSNFSNVFLTMIGAVCSHHSEAWFPSPIQGKSLKYSLSVGLCCGRFFSTWFWLSVTAVGCRHVFS